VVILTMLCCPMIYCSILDTALCTFALDHKALRIPATKLKDSSNVICEGAGCRGVRAHLTTRSPQLCALLSGVHDCLWRTAPGATRSNTLALVLGQLRLTAGVVIRLRGAVRCLRALSMASLLFGISRPDFHYVPRRDGAAGGRERCAPPELPRSLAALAER
jgi:hypothetical protein